MEAHEDKPGAAVEWVDGIFDVVERLTDFPESGCIVPGVGARRIRKVVFGAYRIICSARKQNFT
ncbi:type II toxin-antitoxin system RelE/ParE family toxin [Porticoccus sp.]|uniref:type II toxin-antitoxin system RelE/ParE family toxin n=1 Tax=Porticoccus sp. TaxID=2024853 RepID=UPI003F6A2EEF